MPLAATLRKVPTWGWLVVGGATLGIGYRVYQDKRTADALPPSAGEADAIDAGGDYGGYMVSETPGAISSPPIVVQPTEGGASEVGSIGQTALETLIGGVTGIFEGVPALIEAARPEPQDPPVIQVNIPATPAPGTSPTPPRTSTPSTPAAPSSVTILGRRFAGAYRYAEVPTPKLASRDFNVFFPKPHHDERWRTWIGSDKQRHWRKVAEGNWDAR